MREVTFVRRNARKWQRFEEVVKSPGVATPDELAQLFIELTDDLSYARTFFPNGKTVQYLNALTGSVHRSIFRNRKEDRGRIKRFWKTELPLLMRGHRKELLVAAIVMVIASLIGLVSTLNDEAFVRLIIGDEYVNMTLQNIENDDPMGVYKKTRSVDMFLGITVNNVRVSFIAFAFGMAASIGTVWVLFQNGMMLGAFFGFLYSNGVIAESMETVWIHGTLEIFSIIVAGAAGLVVGNSILFPDSYSRIESFKRGARDGLKMVIGLVPVFIVAGFLEGFVTRLTDMPVFLSYVIIGASAAFIVWYFFLYPAAVERAFLRREGGDAPA
ncbi:MAG: stage II sporulation protein M [Rhodothermales bacterium]|nr:stage II sporulation protein M [Rhodothermales bacterium]